AARCVAGIIDRTALLTSRWGRHDLRRADGGKPGLWTRQRCLAPTGNEAGRDRIVGHVYFEGEDRIEVVAQLFRPAQRDVERLPAFDHLRKRLAAYRTLNDGHHVSRADAPAGALVRVGTQLQVWLAEDVENTDFRHAVNALERGLDLLGNFLQLLEVGTDNLH